MELHSQDMNSRHVYTYAQIGLPLFWFKGIAIITVHRIVHLKQRKHFAWSTNFKGFKIGHDFEINFSCALYIIWWWLRYFYVQHSKYLYGNCILNIRWYILCLIICVHMKYHLADLWSLGVDIFITEHLKMFEKWDPTSNTILGHFMSQLMTPISAHIIKQMNYEKMTWSRK